MAVGQQDSSAREQEMERLIRELAAKVAELERRLEAIEDPGDAEAPPLEGRVDELETSLREMQRAVPPQDEDWAAMREALEKFAAADTMRAYWKDGLRLDSNDGSFKLKIGGRIQYDLGYFGADDEIERTVGELEDSSEFRRARIYVSGDIYDNVDFKVQYDFAGGDADFKDVYMGISGVPVVGNVRLGHFKEPFSLEELTSSNYITFMERSLANVFAPSRNAGIKIFDHALNRRLTWGLGVFRETDDFGEGSFGRDYNVTGRLTGLVWYEDEGRRLVHLGVAYTHKNVEEDVVRFRSRPEAHLAPNFVDTGSFAADYVDTVGAELAVVHGPFSLQGEYIQAFVESRRMADPTFWGANLQASYFLTGEHRPYNSGSGYFERVRPNSNFGRDGWGAWEVAARYSHLDLNNEAIEGGELRDFTLGLNWYLNPNMRIMWNYVRADRTSGGDANAYLMRFQLTF